MQVVVPSPGNGHCILHSLVTQIGGCLGTYLQIINKEINGMMGYYYEERFGQSTEVMNSQLEKYVEGDYDVDLVDSVFQMFANHLEIIIRIDDLYLGELHSFWPVSYNPNRT